ncbi:MAG TPA: glycosyltransferase family 9 protein [Streptosporangiaceae bacterium]|nr:glycosyltransferase family 9 protein [Streptosporangiaceae bacterium]
MRAFALDPFRSRTGIDRFSGKFSYGARRRTLVVRLDDAGEVLLAGPAVRAVARKSHVTFLTAPGGAEAAALLPGVTDVLTWRAPWAGETPPALSAAEVALLVKRMAAGRFDDALIFTSRGQSPLPTAMVLRLAGISHIAAMGSDVPGSLLDVWHDPAADIAEPDRSLALVRAAGYELAPDDDGHLAVRRPLPATQWLTGKGPYVVAHAAQPAGSRRAERWTATIADLIGSGHRVVLTGKSLEHGDPARSAPDAQVVDLAGRTDLLQLAAVVDRAQAVLAGSTELENLAAAVCTPIARNPGFQVPGREPAGAGLG